MTSWNCSCEKTHVNSLFSKSKHELFSTVLTNFAIIYQPPWETDSYDYFTANVPSVMFVYYILCSQLTQVTGILPLLSALKEEDQFTCWMHKCHELNGLTCNLGSNRVEDQFEFAYRTETFWPIWRLWHAHAQKSKKKIQDKNTW